MRFIRFDRKAPALVGATLLVSLLGTGTTIAATLAVPGTYPTIQDAVWAAAQGDHIVLADGVYTWSGAAAQVATISKALTIRSANGPTGCIIDMQGVSGKYGFIAAKIANQTTRIEGLTFRNAMNGYCIATGGGSLVGFRLEIDNCRFEGNTGTHSIVSSSGAVQTQISRTTIRANSCAFPVHIQGNATIVDSRFEENNWTISSGYAFGVLLLSQGTHVVERTVFKDNIIESTFINPFSWGALTFYNASQYVVRDCVFDGNTSTYGSAIANYIHSSVSGEVVNCLFVRNHATSTGSGGTVRLFGALIRNCTFVDNTAAFRGAGVVGASEVRNCIFRGNTAPSFPEFSQVEFGILTNYSNVQGGYDGFNNIDADPMFVNPGAGDYRLLGTSPCIDAGSSGSPALPSTDLDGNDRIVGASVDMGAYEYQTVNHLPAVTSPSPTFEASCQCNSTGTHVELAFDYTDQDGDPLVAHWTVDGGIEQTRNIAAAGPPNTGTYTIEEHLPMGAHVIEFWVVDGVGESNRCQVTVNIVDTDPAVLSLPTGTVYVECHVDTFTETQALAGVTAHDHCSGDLTSLIQVDNPVIPNIKGTYTVTYSVTDPGSNVTTTATRTVVVRDTLAPTITRNGDEFVMAYCGTGWTDPGATASDLCDGPVDVVVTNPADPNRIGTYVVTYTAVDDEGNTSVRFRTVWVIAAVQGLDNPMGMLVLAGTGDPPLPEHSFRRGRTLPLKLQLLCGSMPMGPGEADPPRILSIALVGEAVNLTVVDVNAGGSNDNGLLFRWSDPQWVYNLSTAELAVGTYHITVLMPDGQIFVAAFVLR